jgi:hypothetical protein
MMSKKIKVKSISQNNRKKAKKANLNSTLKEHEIMDSIMRMSNPGKKSQSKMHQTIAFYGHGNPGFPVKFSNRDYLNQSQNSRSSKKKGLAYMKQMMNKTVMIQNKDYQILGKSLMDRNLIPLTLKGNYKGSKISTLSKNEPMVSGLFL